ncbi:MAG: VanW family protein [Armatimonadetes bacterium]|nr:VanW family protein [Armatimonadota bacterium]
MKPPQLIASILVIGFLGGVTVLLLRGPKAVVLAAYTSSLQGRTPAQISNICLASRLANHHKIAHGEIFSLNQTLGPRVPEKGFRPGPTLLEEGPEDQPGGGICQLASALYNVALLSGLQIVERTPHRHVIRSAPPGRDATIYMESLDLKFRNPHPFPVTIVSICRSSYLVVKALAPSPLSDRIEIQTQVLERIPFHKVTRPGVVGTRRKVMRQGIPGFRVQVIRVYRSPSGDERREIMGEDEYDPLDEIHSM